MRWKNADYSGWGRAIVAHGEIAQVPDGVALADHFDQARKAGEARRHRVREVEEPFVLGH